MKPAAGARGSFSRAVFVGTIVFLFLPLLALVFYSFNAAKTPTWGGFSLVWYERLFNGSEALWRALGNSLSIALAAAVVSTLIGTLAAIGVNWYRFKLKKAVQAVTFLPLILPEIIIGVSLLVYFANIRLPLGWFSIFIAHTTFCLPFVYLLVLARLDEFDHSIVEAAHDLGASEMQTLLKVIVPISVPGIISGFLMALTLSLEDFVITFFVNGPGTTTLPVYVNSAIKYGLSPVINALSTIILGCTVLLSLLARNFLKYLAK